MTRQARATSAFTPGRSGSAAGRDARPRDGSLYVDGSGAPAAALKPRDLHYRLSLATAALLIATLAALVIASLASAAIKTPTGDIGTSASGGAAGLFNQPRGVAVNHSGEGPADAGDFYVADGANHRVQQFDADGEWVRAWGADVVVPGGSGEQFSTVDEQQTVTALQAAGFVKGVPIGGTFTLSFDPDGPGGAPAQTTGAIPYNAPPSGDTTGGIDSVQEALEGLAAIDPGDVEVIAAGASKWTVTFTGNFTGTDVSQLTGDGSLLVGTFGPGGILAEVAVTTDRNGGVGPAHEICVEDDECKAGVNTVATGGALNQPTDVAVNQGNGHVYVMDRNNLRVQQFSGDGEFIRAWGGDVVQEGGTGDVVPLVNEVQLVVATAPNFMGNNVPPIGGTFTLSFDPDGPGGAPAQTTGAIPYNAPPSGDTTGGIDSVQEALEGLAGIDPGDVEVITAGASKWTVTFTGDLAGVNIAQMTGDPALLVGAFGTGPAAGAALTVTTQQNGFIGTAFEACTEADECKVGIPGGAGGFFAASSALSGVGVDTAGKVYVADPGNRRVMRFSATGGFERAAGWDVVEAGPGNDVTAPINEFEVCVSGVDTCKAGAGAGAGAGRFGSEAPSFLDVSPTGDVFAVDAANAKIVRLSTALALTDPEFAPALIPGGGALRAIAVDDDADASVYLAKATATDIAEIDPDTEGEIRKHPAGAGNWAGLGVNPENGRAYSASGNVPPTAPGHIVRIMQEGIPIVTTDPATDNDTGVSVTLNGTVNPNAVALQECRFEWGTTTSYDKTAECVPNAAGVGDEESPVAVKAELEGLDPATVYHFRLKARNAGWTRLGINRTFQTAGARILATWSEDVTVAQARLKAQIDPESVATTYRFQYTTGDFEDCGTPDNTACAQTAPQSAGSGTAVLTVSRFLEGLSPSTTYAFRIVTDSAGVANVGPERAFTTYATPSTAGTDCENQQFRTGPAAFLPDCRAYEMVSPVGKNGGDVAVGKEGVLGEDSHAGAAWRQASVNGEALTYSANTAFDGAPGAQWSNQYLSTRDEEAEEWVTEPITAPRGVTVFEPISGPTVADQRWITMKSAQGFSDDLSSYWFRDANRDVFTPDALQPKAPGGIGYANLYRRDSDSGAYEALTKRGPGVPPGGVAPFGSAMSNLGPELANASTEFFGASDDLSVQGFSVGAAMLPDVPHASDDQARISRVYALVDGEAHLVSVLPNGSAAEGVSYPGTRGAPSAVMTTTDSLAGAISDDGRRIFWTVPPSINNGPGTLYVRENPGEPQSAGGACGEPDEAGKACTTQIATGAFFWGASEEDGAHVLYSQGGSPLCSSGAGALCTLRLYDVATKTSTEVASQVWGVAGFAEDLSRVYFVSGQDLDGAGPAQAGEINLYLYKRNGGATTFVAALTVDDMLVRQRLSGGNNAESASTVSGVPRNRKTRVSPGGEHLVFMSNSAVLASQVADYDTTDVATGQPDFQVYRYDAEAGDLACISCKPSGARPRGALLRGTYSPDDIRLTNFSDLREAAGIPAWENSLYASRLLSDDGSRVFFHSEDALLPRDTNGVQDVYLWQAEGKGQCDSDDVDYVAQNEGCVYLISTGRDGSKSEFVDADPLGEEAYISTNQDFDPRDPGLRDVYVAKVGGGFALQGPSAECEGEACQSPPAPPEFGSPSSETFEGPGNQAAGPPARCNRNQVRRGNRCVPKRKLAKRACAKRQGKAKQRCVNQKMRRLSTTGRAGR